MKVVKPEGTSTTNGGTRTRSLTRTMRALVPHRPDVIEAGFVFILSSIALVGFATTFEGWSFLGFAMLGVLLGIVAAHLSHVLHWHWLTVGVLVVVEFFLLGSAIAFREDALAGLLPTLGTLGSLIQVAVGGWKGMLTTLPPLAGDGQYVALPYLLGLVAGAVGFSIARNSKRPTIVLAAPSGLLILVILLGTIRPAAALAQGVTFALGAFGWLAYRYRQNRRVAGAGRANRVQVAAGAALLAVAGLGGSLLGGALPGATTERLVLRSYVQPPVDNTAYASPLAGFRLYSSVTMKMDAAMPSLHDQPLLQVAGGADGQLLRFAVMDDYSGRAWTAAGGPAGAGTGFQRLGSDVPNEETAGKSVLTITVKQAYAETTPGGLAPWIPSLGPVSSVDFSGANGKAHAASVMFNLSTMQGFVTDRLKTNDVLTVVTAPISTDAGQDPVPGGAPVTTMARYSFVSSATKKMSGSATGAWQRLMSVAQTLKAGYWSDGTSEGETQYLPGSGQGRLTQFLTQEPLVGSDEQYASAFGLMAEQLGFPARVVMGAILPTDGNVRGQDVHAWVEVQTSNGWVAIPPDTFIPSRDKHPPTQPQEVAKDARAKDVPPPNPARAPGTFDQLNDGQLAGSKLGTDLLSTLLRIVLGILGVIGPPLAALLGLGLLIVGAKALRTRIRRTRGTPAQRVAAGWRDAIDRLRDAGTILPVGGTRLEQSRSVSAGSMTGLAEEANALTFGPEDPDVQSTTQYWLSVAATKKALLTPLTRRRRLLARLNVRSLLPEQLASIPLPHVPRPSWLKVPRLRLSLPRRPSIREVQP